MPLDRRPLRVLHTADVHLGSDAYGNAEQRAAYRLRELTVFRRIVDRALADRVDLLLIAGDLFDHNRVSDEIVGFVQTELDRFRGPVVVLPGNHDSVDAGGIYDRHIAGSTGRVHVIRRPNGESIELPELGAIVWGRGMQEHAPEFSPLAHVPGRVGRRWQIAMAHGFFYEARRRPDRSSPIFADEIRDSGCDYLALGHQHVQTDVSQGAVTAYYSGAPLIEARDSQPRGSVLCVDLSDEHGVRVTPRPLF